MYWCSYTFIPAVVLDAMDAMGVQKKKVKQTIKKKEKNGAVVVLPIGVHGAGGRGKATVS